MKERHAIYVERLRLVLSGVGGSLWVGVVLATLLLGVFWQTNRHDVAHGWLVGWFAATILARMAVVLFSKRMLLEDRFSDHLDDVAQTLLKAKVIEGLIWGSLAWIVVSPQGADGNTALVLAVMAAVSSNAVSLLAPIMRIYLALVLPMLMLAAARFITLDGVIFKAIGVSCALYVVGQVGQVRIIGRSMMDTIRLRFQNLALIEQLRVETADATKARAAAEQANQAKSQFLAAASHDLRQPVHALGLFLEALSQHNLDDSQSIIVRNAKAASMAPSEMLDTLLDFSRLEAGVIQPVVAPFSLQPLLHKLEVELAPQADAKGLIYRSRETNAIVRSDPALLELVLRNLISNAIRYTERGGIFIGCRKNDTTIRIRIHDTGIGIHPDQHGDIFREFHQLGNPERDRRKGLGLGLGLAIAERLARSLGHRLSVASTPGRGSCFEVQVRRTFSVPAALPATPLIDQPDRLAGMRVLVIDDDESVLQGMRHLLERWGCPCIVAESLDDAVDIGELSRIHVMICDYRLRDGRTGAEAIAALRSQVGWDIPAVLVTGDTAPERLRDASASGIPLLHKPVSPSELRAALAASQAR